MKKKILFIAMLVPALANGADGAGLEFTKVEEFSGGISAMVLGYCAGLHLKTTDEQVACINDGFDTALKVIEKKRAQSSVTSQNN